MGLESGCSFTGFCASWASHKAAIKGSAYGLQSHLKVHLGKAHPEIVGSIQFLADSWIKGLSFLLAADQRLPSVPCHMGLSNMIACSSKCASYDSNRGSVLTR